MQNYLALPHPPRSWRTGFLLGSAILLALPLGAMAFTSEVAWGLEDFVAASALLAFLWLGIEGLWRLLATPRSRVFGVSAISVAALLLWAHLAVGVF